MEEIFEIRSSTEILANDIKITSLKKKPLSSTVLHWASSTLSTEDWM